MRLLCDLWHHIRNLVLSLVHLCSKSTLTWTFLMIILSVSFSSRSKTAAFLKMDTHDNKVYNTQIYTCKHAATNRGPELKKA